MKWLENWLKRRKASHQLITRLMTWQINYKARKEARAILKRYKKNQQQTTK